MIEASDDWLRVDLGSASAIFTTRTGPGPSRASGYLDLSRNSPDSDLVRSRVAVAAGAQGRRLHAMSQQHGALVEEIGTLIGHEPECDALITSDPGVALLCVTADCLPIAVASTGRVAVIHAGWRGLAAGVIGETISRFPTAELTGGIVAAIGPAAGSCCYEVSDDVLAAIGASARHEGRMLDLAATAAGQLEQFGTREVVTLPHCTICDEQSRFHSFRRDGAAAGRQGVIAWLNR